MLKQSAMSAVVVSGLVLGLAGTARAQVLNDTLTNGPPITASALLAAGGGFTYPSVFGLRADRTECVRIEGTGSTFNAEFTVVAPNGQVYRDNDGGAGNLPLVKIGSAPNTGVYTLMINDSAGAAVASGTVTFTYGRYSAGSANCAAPTPPL